MNVVISPGCLRVKIGPGPGGSTAAVNTLVIGEIPTGLVNGTNLVYTISQTPLNGSVEVFLNGLRQTVTNDYTISGVTITMILAPVSPDTIITNYVI
jgi:hypothetical protein